MEEPGPSSTKIESEEILTHLECPVCLEYIFPPIKQCEKGHLLCKDCHSKVQNCPTCRGKLSEERNLTAEKIAFLLKYPCRFNTNGCKEALTLSAKEKHEKNCEYLQMKCPFHFKCQYTGTMFETEKHLKSVHNVTPIDIQESGIFFYRCQKFYKRDLFNMIFKWDGYLFRFLAKCIHSTKIGRPKHEGSQILAHVQYIGAVNKLASKYAYVLELFEPRSRRKGTKFESIVTAYTNLEDHLEDVFRETTKTATKFIETEKMSLGFMIYMKRLTDDIVTIEEDDTEEVEDQNVQLPQNPGPSNVSKTKDKKKIKNRKRKANEPLTPPTPPARANPPNFES